MRPRLRTKDDALIETAAALRGHAVELEQLAGDPSHMPPPPREPKVSWHQSIRAKKISVPAAGGWAAGIACAVEIVRAVWPIVAEHLSR